MVWIQEYVKAKKFDFTEIKKRARELRNNMTESEMLLWQELKGKKLAGYRFLRQHPILYKGNLTRYNYFIADFYCDAKKIILELDGPVHEESEEYDEWRDSELREMGLNVLRIKNEELNNMPDVLNRIIQFLNTVAWYSIIYKANFPLLATAGRGIKGVGTCRQEAG